MEYWARKLQLLALRIASAMATKFLRCSPTSFSSILIFPPGAFPTPGISLPVILEAKVTNQANRAENKREELMFHYLIPNLPSWQA